MSHRRKERLSADSACHYAARCDSGGMARLVGLVPDQPDTFYFADARLALVSWEVEVLSRSNARTEMKYHLRGVMMSLLVKVNIPPISEPGNKGTPPCPDWLARKVREISLDWHNINSTDFGCDDERNQDVPNLISPARTSLYFDGPSADLIEVGWPRGSTNLGQPQPTSIKSAEGPSM
ncbi:hypothetical protein B0H19DRAFT_1241578 [Mycena capillaripes]|nr:hypothetical protein B0H19DRAFT_1241578 [Mycena capillaripes]